MVPSIPIRIQNYIDELDANVLVLDKYDMILSMIWLDAYSPTIDYRTKSVTFQHNSNTITLQPMPVDKDVHTPADSKQPVLSSVADINTSLIKDDQQLIVREGVPGCKGVSLRQLT